jgi:hypothetical protein
MRALAAALLSFVSGAASSLSSSSAVVWSGLTPDGSGVTVFADDSYAVLVNGTAWLSSLPTSLHLNGTWWAAAGAPNATTVSGGAGTCPVEQDVDCHGDDLFDFNATGPDDCCANCSATAGCGAWTWTGQTEGASPSSSSPSSSSSSPSSAPPPWANRCYIKADCSGKMSYQGHVSGLPASAWPSPLTRLGAEAVNGTDQALGPFTGWRVRYAATDPAATQMWVTVKFFAAVPQPPPLHAWSAVPAPAPAPSFFVFEQLFPSGAVSLANEPVQNGTNSPCMGRRRRLTTPLAPASEEDSAASNPGLGEFCSSMQPSTVFPAFAGAPTSPADGGFLTWTGRFFYPSTSAGGPAAGLGAAGGAEGGPLVLFANDGVASAGGVRRPGHALVLSAFNDFKANIAGPAGPAAAGATGPSAGFGVSGYASDLAPGHTISTVLSFSASAPSGGVTEAVMAWGAGMRAAYGTTRLQDPFLASLSYSTDNGAYYDWYSYPDILSRGVPQDVLVALMETFRNGTYEDPFNGGPALIPVAAGILIDAYWYPFSRPNGNCKLSDEVWSVPFPNGLQWLREQVGVPLQIYNGPTCANATIANEWPVVYSTYWDQGWGAGVLLNVHPDSSEAYYASLFARKEELGMVTFETDFMDFNHLLFPAFTTNGTAARAWLMGINDAAVAAGLPVQSCMSLPSDALAHLETPAYTNARASQDYGAGGDSNWRIAASSLLLSAVGLQPSKDNFWCVKEAGQGGGGWSGGAGGGLPAEISMRALTLPNPLLILLPPPFAQDLVE